MRHVLIALAVLLGLAALADDLRAGVIEERIDVPVRVSTSRGSAQQTIPVVIFRPEGQERRPYLLLLHGRAAHANERQGMGLVRFTAQSRYFAGLGFVVLVPTRVGYGSAGGPDVEESGACDNKAYQPVYEAGAQQAEQVIAHARTLPYVDGSRGVVVGQSFGGVVSLALAGRRVPGLRAAVNFAGGGGGNPRTRPGMPCSPDRLRELFASYGRQASVPTMWLYSANDRWMGTEAPRQWHARFTAGGGQARFVSLPAFGDDGHGSFIRNPAAWRPEVAGFLRGVGLPR